MATEDRSLLDLASQPSSTAGLRSNSYLSNGSSLKDIVAATSKSAKRMFRLD